MSIKHTYFSTKGRLSRRDYIVKFYAVWLTIYIVSKWSFNLIYQLQPFVSDVRLDINVSYQNFAVMFHSAFFWLTFWPYLVTLIKRFRDVGASVRLYFLYVLMFFVFITMSVMVFLFFAIIVQAMGIDHSIFIYIPFYLSILGFLLLPALIRGRDDYNESNAT